ncbi:MAG: LysR family transcriptional regulator, partial [Candidatus Nucleicultricaceae bacterium]
MDLDRLRVFHMVAKEGSIYKASERLRIASSAVSRTIQLLEESLENKLFLRRQSKGVELTPFGQFLLSKTEEILAIAHEAEFAAKDMDKEPKGLLKIISTPGVMKNFIIKFIPSFIKKYPKIELVLHTTTDASLVNNGVDVAIGPYHNTS